MEDMDIDDYSRVCNIICK
ncbi:unnamed protein product [Debaryomyces fabryi]|nr:unnamed protein product [Debaryomyces fabryi]